MLQRVAFICALALIVLPFTSAAQSTPAQQQDQTDDKQPAAEPNSQQNRDTDAPQSDTPRSDIQDDADDAATDPDELPATAGELPLLALIGAFALAGAAGTRLAPRAK